VIAIILALVVLFFIYRKLKWLFVLLILGLFLAGLLYIISTMAGSGSEQKRKLIPREETQSDRNP
jgi:energy-coupling factor transporter transmembrane protein EcfT